MASKAGRSNETDACETFMSRHLLVSLMTVLLAGCILHSRSTDEPVGRVDLGQPTTAEDIRPWDFDVSPDGQGLPPGRGTVPQGAAVYAAKCAKCHGSSGTEGPMDRLVGGQHSLATTSPVKTIGSYWPYATTLYDYIHRAMPFDAPQSLTPDEVYSVTAWLLHQNGIIAENAVIDSSTLAAIQMPNRH